MNDIREIQATHAYQLTTSKSDRAARSQLRLQGRKEDWKTKVDFDAEHVERRLGSSTARSAIDKRRRDPFTKEEVGKTTETSDGK